MERGLSGSMGFLFTGVEGVTSLWEDHPAEVEQALGRHDEIQRDAFVRHGGRVFAADGEGFAVSFEDTQDAVDAAIDAQRALAEEPWPEDLRLRSRMGV